MRVHGVGRRSMLGRSAGAEVTLGRRCLMKACEFPLLDHCRHRHRGCGTRGKPTFPQVRALNAVWTGWWSLCGKVARPVGGRSVPTRRPPRWGAPSTRTRPSSTVIHRTAHRDGKSGASTDCVRGCPSTSSTGKPRRNPRVLDLSAWLWPGAVPRDHADVTTHSNPVDDCGQLGPHAVYEPPSWASGRGSAEPVARYPQIRAPRWGTLWMVGAVREARTGLCSVAVRRVTKTSHERVENRSGERRRAAVASRERTGQERAGPLVPEDGVVQGPGHPSSVRVA